MTQAWSPSDKSANITVSGGGTIVTSADAHMASIAATVDPDGTFPVAYVPAFDIVGWN